MIKEPLTRTERNLRTAMFALSVFGVMIGIYMLFESINEDIGKRCNEGE